MAGPLITIDECNQRNVSIFFDANVLFAAIREEPPAFELFSRTRPSLRLIASATLFEVAFARSGRAPETLADNWRWLRRHRVTWVRPTADEARTVGQYLDRRARQLRGLVDLGDFFAACCALATRTIGKPVAFASRDHDFAAIPVPLVQEFRP